MIALDPSQQADAADEAEGRRAKLKPTGFIDADPTEKQFAILFFIADFLKEHRYPPSIRDIGDAFGLSSTNGVNDHLRALVRRGLLTRIANKARTLTLTATGFSLYSARRRVAP
jgi:repressor LexA